jgi:hypothetical protein
MKKLLTVLCALLAFATVSVVAEEIYEVEYLGRHGDSFNYKVAEIMEEVWGLEEGQGPGVGDGGMYKKEISRKVFSSTLIRKAVDLAVEQYKDSNSMWVFYRVDYKDTVKNTHYIIFFQGPWSDSDKDKEESVKYAQVYSPKF